MRYHPTGHIFASYAILKLSQIFLKRLKPAIEKKHYTRTSVGLKRPFNYRSRSHNYYKHSWKERKVCSAVFFFLDVLSAFSKVLHEGLQIKQAFSYWILHFRKSFYSKADICIFKPKEVKAGLPQKSFTYYTAVKVLNWKMIQ